jgi:hypothetical protein
MFTKIVNLYEKLRGKISNETREELWANMYDIIEYGYIEKKEWATKDLLNSMRKYNLPVQLKKERQIINYIYMDNNIDINARKDLERYMMLMCEMSKWDYKCAMEKMRRERNKYPMKINPILFYFLKRLHNLV